VVIHLHRDSAVEPFTQGLPASSLLGLLKAAFVLEQQGGEVNHGHQSVTSTSSQGDGVGGHEKGGACGPEGTRERISVRAEAQSQIAECLKRAQSAEAQHALLIVEFQNLFEYLQVGEA